MLNVLLVTHGHLGEEFLSTARMVFGEPGDGIGYLGFCPGESQDSLFSEIVQRVRESPKEGCLILTDIIGGSPFLMAARAYQELHDDIPVDVVSGLSLGMLLEVLSVRSSSSLSEGVQTALDAASQSVQVLSDKLGK